MTEREKLIEDLMREVLYGTGEEFDQVVEEIRQDGGVVRVRLRGPAHGFELAWEEGTGRAVLAARLERQFRLAREGPDRARPPIED